MSEGVRYSKLCDSSIAAYFAYIAAVSTSNGKLAIEPAGNDGRSGVDACGGGSDDIGGDVVGVYGGLLDKTRNELGSLDFDNTTSSVRGYISGVLGITNDRCAQSAAGVADCDDGVRVSGVDSDIRDECGRDGGRVAGSIGSKAGRVVSDGDHVRPRTLLNRAKRLKRKQRKLVKQGKLGTDLPERVEIVSDVPEWRRGLGRNGKPLKDDTVGFWKSCSNENRQRLIDSKAEMHIAENQRRAREARNRIDYLDSTQAIVDQVTMLVGKAQKLAGKEGNEKVLGWAKTVTSSSAESLARSAPSTVPSFESVSTAVDEAIKLEQARAACAKDAADQENMRRAAELEATNVQLKETIARLEREAAARVVDRRAPIPVKQARAAVPDVNCAPVRRDGETVAEHLARFRKYLEIRDGIQKGGSSAFVFKP